VTPRLSWNVLLDLDSRRGPLHQRLTSALRAAIRDGRVPLESALPPSRVLAADLGVSRWTVTRAYDQLTAEGYLAAHTGSGTRVRWAPDSTAARAPRAPGRAAAPARYDMTPGRPDLRAFPANRWVEAIRQAVATAPHDQLGYPDPDGSPRLRGILAEYLNRARGAVVAANDVTICLRAAEALARVCGALVADGIDDIAVEDPGWQPAGQIAAAAGLGVIPIPVDAEGLRVSELRRHPRVRAVCVAASHQFPAGAVLSPGRRAALLAWAKDNDGRIVEDDYDAEFRYDRPAVSTLQGMAPGRVFLLGSVSKTMAPAVGIGWVASPPRLTGALRAASPFPLAPPTVHQLALAGFIESGAYDRHLRAARRRYRDRRRAVLDALARELPGYPVAGAAAGLHLLLWLPAGTDAGRVVASAAERGLLVASLDRFRARPDPARPGLVLGYGNLADSAAPAAISVLASAVGDT
jgi:GntR family transcriptional regulator / MocR family aminotransferase